jgi:hypothetical protein
MTVEGLVSCTCIMENTAVFILLRREIGERNGIKSSTVWRRRRLGALCVMYQGEWMQGQSGWKEEINSYT